MLLGSCCGAYMRVMLELREGYAGIMGGYDAVTGYRDPPEGYAAVTGGL